MEILYVFIDKKGTRDKKCRTGTSALYQLYVGTKVNSKIAPNNMAKLDVSHVPIVEIRCHHQIDTLNFTANYPFAEERW